MSETISNVGLNPLRPLPPADGSGKPDSGNTDFARIMRDQLQHVNELQNAADDQVAKLLSGESDNMTEVFVAARKSQVAFSLLMEIRNKLIDAYDEVKNMRV